MNFFFLSLFITTTTNIKFRPRTWHYTWTGRKKGSQPSLLFTIDKFGILFAHNSLRSVKRVTPTLISLTQVGRAFNSMCSFYTLRVFAKISLCFIRSFDRGHKLVRSHFHSSFGWSNTPLRSHFFMRVVCFVHSDTHRWWSSKSQWKRTLSLLWSWSFGLRRREKTGLNDYFNSYVRTLKNASFSDEEEERDESAFNVAKTINALNSKFGARMSYVDSPSWGPFNASNSGKGGWYSRMKNEINWITNSFSGRREGTEGGVHESMEFEGLGFEILLFLISHGQV